MDCVRAHPEEVTIVCLGPMTNIARAFRRDPNVAELVDRLVITGGSGVAPRDVTPEAVQPLLTRPLPGFGELFRSLSYAEVGANAFLSRAFAGLIEQTAVFALPGSTAACRTAVTQLIVPALGHLVGLARG